MVKVISLIPYPFLPAKNGGQKNIALFNQHFAQQVEFKAITVSNNDNSLATYETLPMFSASIIRYLNPFYIPRICKLIRKEKTSHLMIEHPYMGWLALVIKWFTSVSFIIHSHNIESLRFKSIGKWWWKILWHYERFIHIHADHSFFITEEDRQYAIQHFGIPADKAWVVTFGIERNQCPTKEEKLQAFKQVRQQYGILDEEHLLLFAGAFNYGPNMDAYKVIRDQICPALDKLRFPYKMLVCGGGLEMEKPTFSNIIIAGFVKDIHLYFKAADVFVNPIMDGGGIKTKLVEALGNNTNAVSTEKGSIGLNQALTGDKLLIVTQNDLQLFANMIIAMSAKEANTPTAFFEHFYIENIARKATCIIKG